MKNKLSEAVKNKTIGDIELFEELGVTTDLEIEEHEEFVDWIDNFKGVKHNMKLLNRDLKELKHGINDVQRNINKCFLTESEYWKNQAQFYKEQGEKDVVLSKEQGKLEANLSELNKSFENVDTKLDKLGTTLNGLGKRIDKNFILTWVVTSILFVATGYLMWAIHGSDNEVVNQAMQLVEQALPNAINVP